MTRNHIALLLHDVVMYLSFERSSKVSCNKSRPTQHQLKTIRWLWWFGFCFCFDFGDASYYFVLGVAPRYHFGDNQSSKGVHVFSTTVKKVRRNQVRDKELKLF
jgi:hypothetical protein